VKSLFKCCFKKTSFALTLGLFGAVLAFTGCAQSEPSKGVSQTTPLEIKPRTAEPEQIRVRAGQLPEVTLTSSIVFRVLAAEISAQRSAFIPAGKTMLDLAQEVGDVRLARRAGHREEGQDDLERPDYRTAPPCARRLLRCAGRLARLRRLRSRCDSEHPCLCHRMPGGKGAPCCSPCTQIWQGSRR
jgi:hypothetical protein